MLRSLDLLRYLLPLHLRPRLDLLLRLLTNRRGAALVLRTIYLRSHHPRLSSGTLVLRLDSSRWSLLRHLSNRLRLLRITNPRSCLLLRSRLDTLSNTFPLHPSTLKPLLRALELRSLLLRRLLYTVGLHPGAIKSCRTALLSSQFLNLLSLDTSISPRLTSDIRKLSISKLAGRKIRLPRGRRLSSLICYLQSFTPRAIR
jgi:hypothetical protein